MPAFVPATRAPGTIKLFGSGGTVFAPLPSVYAAITQATADAINCYPDNGCVELKSALAKHLNSADAQGQEYWSPEHLAIGCGSVSLCQQLIQITATVGDEVVFGWPSFALYALQVRIAGATAIPVQLTNDTVDLQALLAAITHRTRLIFVCNPNNPTSTAVNPDALARFVEAVPAQILIVIDEAYVEYVRDGALPDSWGLARAHNNVVVLRTFSKAYGLAGLRVGYAVGHPEVITALNKVYVPFSVTSIAQAAAIASLDAPDELRARVDAVVAERLRVGTALRDAGFALPPSQTNFVWLPLGVRTPDFVEQAAKARVVVQPCGTYGVPVAIGSPEDNDAFLRFARNWIKRSDETAEQVDIGPPKTRTPILGQSG